MCPLRPGQFARSDHPSPWSGSRGPVVPPDAVTASGSGLDPDISPAYARLQLPRVAEARGVSIDELEAVVAAHTRGRTIGFLGEPTVNVLDLNLDLDNRYPYRA